MGNINTILPTELDEETEEILLNKIKSKMLSSISLYVSTLRFIEKEYGKDALEKIHQFQLNRTIDRLKKLGSEVEDNSLETFCIMMENSCAGTHGWKKLVDTKNRKSYKFTRCMWAEIFRSLNAEDIGLWICEGDAPAATAFNPKIKLKRTKTLMEGHDYCDHNFYIEKECKEE